METTQGRPISKETILRSLPIKTYYEREVPTIRWNGKEGMALCPFHEDSKPSLSVNPETGVYFCHGCGEKGNIFDFHMSRHTLSFPDALKELAVFAGIAEPQEKKIVATYDYTDEAGALLYQVVRYEPKDFRQRQPNGKGDWTWNLDGIMTVPYNLPQVIAAETVFVVEGERDVEALKGIELVGTTNPQGAGKWKARYNEYFTGKNVVVIPDNDDVGKRHGASIAKNLSGIAKTIKIVNLPNLPEKGDVSDWIAKGETKEALLDIVNNTSEWQEQRIGQSEEPDRKKAVPQAEKLIDIGSELTLFHDDMKEAFAEMPGQNMKVRSAPFKQWLSKQLWQGEHKAPNSDALNQALNVLEAMAIHDGNMRKLSNRIATYEGTILYDLGNGSAIRVTPGRWEVVSDPPMIFKRYSHQQAQVEPKGGGELQKLFKYLNITKKDHRLLAQILLVCYFIPEIAHPILHPWGDQGSGKTTICNIFKLLIDPSKLSVFFAPRDLNETIQALEHHYFLAFDNLSEIPAWLSDLLSQAVTGAGLSKRKLYTDDEDHVFQLKRCVSLNGINQLIYKPDAMDRSILIHHSRIEPEHRRSETALYAEFEDERPYLIGAVFDVLAQAMEIISTIQLSQLPRMADFALWGCAIAEALGFTQQDFLEAYSNNMKAQNSEIVGGNTLAQAVLSFMDDKEIWEGTVGEAFAKLLDIAKPKDRDKTFPKAPNKLRKHLERIRPNLLDYGVKFIINDYHAETGVHITFQKLPKVTSESSGLQGTSKIEDLQTEDRLNITEAPSAPSGVSSGHNINNCNSSEHTEHTEDEKLTLWENECFIPEIDDPDSDRWEP